MANKLYLHIETLDTLHHGGEPSWIQTKILSTCFALNAAAQLKNAQAMHLHKESSVMFEMVMEGCHSWGSVL